VLNAANEVAVGEFLHRRIPFGKIAQIVDEVLSNTPQTAVNSLEEVFAADRQARELAEAYIRRIK